MSKRINNRKNISIKMTGKGLTSFASILIPENVFSINLSNNEIYNFSCLPKINSLTELILDENPIESFSGACFQPSLKFLSLRNTKIVHFGKFKIMCLVVFGSHLKYINGERVTSGLRKIADKIRPKILNDIEDGSILMKFNPIKLVNFQVGEAMENYITNIHKSPALICNEFLEGKFVPSLGSIKYFQSKFNQIKMRYGLPLQEEGKFQSEGSFVKEMAFRKIEIPKGIVLSDYYYSDSEEEDQKNSSKEKEILEISLSDSKSSSCLSD